jgi:DNA helicase TIP49 (TBP-interacting protein)
MTLLLGPPGSGKTTLLLALAGRLGNDLKVFQVVGSLPIAKCFSRKKICRRADCLIVLIRRTELLACFALLIFICPWSQLPVFDTEYI